MLPLGGLARRATVIARARAEADAALVVDAGDLFAPQGTRGRDRAPGPAPGRRGRTRRDRRLHAWRRRSGDRRCPRLKRLTTAHKIPVVSANLYGRDGQRLFPADRLIDAAGTRIGIFGVTAPPTAADANRWRADGIVVRDPADAAREAAASLRTRGAAIVVALVHAGLPAENRRLVRGHRRDRLGGAGAQRAQPGTTREGGRPIPAGGDVRGEEPRPARPARRRRRRRCSPTGARAPSWPPRSPTTAASWKATTVRSAGSTPRRSRIYYQQRRQALSRPDRARDPGAGGAPHRHHRELVRKPHHPPRPEHPGRPRRGGAGPRISGGGASRQASGSSIVRPMRSGPPARRLLPLAIAFVALALAPAIVRADEAADSTPARSRSWRTAR